MDTTAFREAMGALPTGVTIVTTLGPDGPAGATANAVSSLSLEPMMMMAALDRGSRTLLALQAANRFGVNVLGAGQAAIAERFSLKGPVKEKWEGVGFSEHDGVPVIEGAIASVRCELVDLIAGGDHVIVTGNVLGAEVAGGEPLIFHRGGYRGLGG